MRTSLRKRIAISFIALVVAALVAIGLIHFFLIEDFYLANKEAALLKSFEMVETEDKEAGMSQDFSRYCTENSLIYAVADDNFTPYAANTRDVGYLVNRFFGLTIGYEDENMQIKRAGDNYQIMMYSDDRAGVQYLELWGILSNGDHYIVRCPVQSIKAAASLSMAFYLIVGIIVIAGSVVIILLLTQRLTKPVRELTVLSEKMAGMDFTAKYTSGGQDEVGIMGANFNTMASRLENTISELRNANAKLEKDIEEKERRDEQRKELLSNISHELKTPIALIQGYSEGLKEMQLDDSSREFYCDVICDEAAKMNRLVQQIITLNQMEEGQDPLTVTVFDLTALIKGVLDASTLMIKDNQAEVIFDDSASVMVRGDEFKTEEIISNYLVNALNHLEGEKKIIITCKEENGLVETSIFNTGQPIPAKELDRIWDKFYKVDKARTREYGGSGIGLSIVKAICDLHGQKCGAVNENDGVRFYFTLPCG